MISHSSGINFSSPVPTVPTLFWNLIRGRIEEGDRKNLEWLISYCRQKFFGNSEMSHLLNAEDLLEHLSRDTRLLII